MDPSKHSRCSAFSMSMMSTTTPKVVPKGSAAKPYEKQKVAVFGAGGYLGGCIYGFLQRAGSLYGTGISGVGGSPRAVVATSAGSVSLNGILSKNFILAQADESFVKLTNMTIVDAIQSRLNGFDAAILGTRFTLEPRPVTLGSYEKSPNDKTMEFYMERPRIATVKGIDDPNYSLQLFNNILQACKSEGLRHLVVIETDSEFDTDTVAGDKYLALLEEVGVPYTYIRPVGSFENLKEYTYAKGVQSTLKITQPTSLEEFQSGSGTLYREDFAAVCVQALLSLDWSDNRVLQVEPVGSLGQEIAGRAIPQREWCMNSDSLQELLAVAS
ncbi:hypothetical protein IV203_002118 [Nitzschia inconspicua]|uniref:Uncharacterized protein n=1 Tax=Nitzschia inconspicua TaxID=303405 RepID=A0A9K3PRN6_9STRA|nr:hypothetical protein IV203_002442 [Nitzschia inconspicua]KAG7357430.1 hypothetical protein IV203_002118 [Nitzschia inconspicua]